MCTVTKAEKERGEGGIINVVIFVPLQLKHIMYRV